MSSLHRLDTARKPDPTIRFVQAATGEWRALVQQDGPPLELTTEQAVNLAATLIERVRLLDIHG